MSLYRTRSSTAQLLRTASWTKLAQALCLWIQMMIQYYVRAIWKASCSSPSSIVNCCHLWLGNSCDRKGIERVKPQKDSQLKIQKHPHLVRDGQLVVVEV